MAFEGWKERAEELEAQVYALYFAARDPRTPVYAKGVIVLIVAYAISPIDPIPDFIPGLGYLDELLVLPFGVALAIRLVPEPVMADCRERADEEIDAGRARWVVAALVLLVWIAIAILAIRTFTNWM